MFASHGPASKWETTLNSTFKNMTLFHFQKLLDSFLHAGNDGPHAREAAQEEVFVAGRRHLFLVRRPRSAPGQGGRAHRGTGREAGTHARGV